MKPEEVKFLSDGIVDLLPDDPKLALAVLAITYANVIVATECAEADALEALRRALAQMRCADRSRPAATGAA